MCIRDRRKISDALDSSIRTIHSFAVVRLPRSRVRPRATRDGRTRVRSRLFANARPRAPIARVTTARSSVGLDRVPNASNRIESNRIARRLESLSSHLYGRTNRPASREGVRVRAHGHPLPRVATCRHEGRPTNGSFIRCHGDGRFLCHHAFGFERRSAMRKQRCANHTRGVPRPESDPSEIWNGRSTVGFCLLMGVCVPSLCTVQ